MVESVIRKSLVYLGSSTPFQILNFLGGVLLARMLVPEHFGIIALALAAKEWVSISIACATPQFFILGDGSESSFQKSYTLAFIVAAILIILGLVFFLSQQQNFEGNFPEIIFIFFVCEGLVVISSITLAPLERDLELLKLSLIRNISSFFGTAVAVAIAFFSQTIWALVAREVAIALLLLVFGVFNCNQKLKLNFSGMPKKLFPIIKYGWSLNFSRAWETLFYRLPELLVAKLFGVSLTGHFVQARNFQMIALKIPNTLLDQIFFTTIVSMKKDGKSYEYFCFVQVFTSRLMLVGAWCMAFVGPSIFLYLFGEQWHEASELIPYLAGFIFFASLFNGAQAFFYSEKKQTIVSLSYAIGVLSFLSLMLWPTFKTSLEHAGFSLTVSMATSCLFLHLVGFLVGQKLPVVKIFALPFLTLVVFCIPQILIGLELASIIIFSIICFSIYEIQSYYRNLFRGIHD